MNPPPKRILDPQAAIWNRDLQELSDALEAGWTLPRARVKDGGTVEDLALVIRVVSLRWVEGWRVLAHRFPQLRASPVLWTLALRRAVPGVVADLLEHGQSPTRPLENGQAPLHVVAEAMGPMPGEVLEETDLVATAQTLVAAGADPAEPFPGDFRPGALGPAGHTLWTRAVYFGRWQAVRAFAPQSWEALVALPRGTEMLEDLRKSSQDNGQARQAWAELMGQWVDPWLAAHPDDPFAGKADLAVLTNLSPPSRQQVWQRWDRADGTGWTGLHDLALLGAEPEAHRALALALADQAACLGRWTQPDADGMRPCDLWEIANHRPAPAPSLDPPGPGDLPEVRAAA